MATFENCNSPSILTLVRVKARHRICLRGAGGETTKRIQTQCQTDSNHNGKLNH